MNNLKVGDVVSVVTVENMIKAGLAPSKWILGIISEVSGLDTRNPYFLLDNICGTSFFRNEGVAWVFGMHPTISNQVLVPKSLLNDIQIALRISLTDSYSGQDIEHCRSTLADVVELVRSESIKARAIGEST